MKNECWCCGSEYPSGMKLPVRWDILLEGMPAMPDMPVVTCIQCSNRMLFACCRVRNQFQPHNQIVSEAEMQKEEATYPPIVAKPMADSAEDVICGG